MIEDGGIKLLNSTFSVIMKTCKYMTLEKRMDGVRRRGKQIVKPAFSVGRKEGYKINL